MSSTKPNNELVAFQSLDNEVEFQVRIDNIDDTVWATQQEIIELFGKARGTIVDHINNIFKEGELDKEQTCRKFRQVQKEGKKQVTREILHYNLDVIISVGYRVKSKRGVEFRKWATKTLKKHLISGFTENKKRLDQLQQTIQLIQRTALQSDNLEDTKELWNVLSDYTQALDILDDYDHQKITTHTTNNVASFKIEYNEAKIAIEQLRQKFGASSLFGNEKDASFKSSIAVIDQTFDGKELYPTIEEKAANLLYLVVKNHSFTDGNKRIAAWLFVWYLHQNNFLYAKEKGKKISNSTLVAVTLMIAESSPSEKEILISVIVHILHTIN